ncbi:hypothetical protein AB0N87_11865 [Streptomyces sp. NPDC093228]|nr:MULTISPECIES: hypothetical protein [unclassified Streptomyces]MDX3258163.1 hypothetical protein [Streptomyces sp. MI02-2A]REE58435.1 hypothetical protein BX257_0857 [Streptomyces sp. 3212.3]
MPYFESPADGTRLHHVDYGPADGPFVTHADQLGADLREFMAGE